MSGDNGFTDLLAEANDLLDDTIALRRRIHMHPELGLENPRTQEAVVESIEDIGLSYRLGEATTSVVATIEGARPGRTILLRADTDALPLTEDTGLDYCSRVERTMHACGHDAHTAMLVTAARLLDARKADLGGRVVLAFQPGEEGFHGAKVMLDEGLLDATGSRTDLAFAIHQTPTMPSGWVGTRGGALMASADTLEITVRGRGGHASMPHHALDPIPVACEIVTALQAYVTRRVDAFDPGVVTIAKIRAGTTTNVIPETASLWGTVRTVSARTRAAVLEGVKRVAEGIASAHEMEAVVTLTPGYPVTVNDDDAASFVLDVANELVGEKRTVTLPSPVMGAEDFSYVLEEVPGAMAFLGTRPEHVEGPVAPNHSNRMMIDEKAMASGAALYAAMALRFLTT